MLNVRLINADLYTHRIEHMQCDVTARLRAHLLIKLKPHPTLFTLLLLPLLVVRKEDGSLKTIFGNEDLQGVLTHEEDVAVFVGDAVPEEKLERDCTMYHQ